MYQFPFTTATTTCLSGAHIIKYKEYIHKLKRKPRQGNSEVGPITEAPKIKLKGNEP